MTLELVLRLALAMYPLAEGCQDPRAQHLLPIVRAVVVRDGHDKIAALRRVVQDVEDLGI